MIMCLPIVASLLATTVAPPPTGPLLGDLTADSVRMWLQAPSDEPVSVEVRHGTERPDGATVATFRFEDSDSVSVRITSLQPDTRYTYRIDDRADPAWWFRTRPAEDRVARLAFASCADEDEGSGRVWDRMNEDRIDGLVLLGDTPYIDTTKLDHQRRRYREFAAFPPFARLVAHTPVYSTWDDHDFGLNDIDGRLPGKENSRRAFAEHRPNPSFGEHDEGVYTSFRLGPIEVFLLDTRWFARTTGGIVDPTLLGAAQWEWLARGLESSTAPFRILACGMIFNDATRPGKTDHWGMYPKEYDRLLDLLERTGSDGVLLVSGDVHWSRVIEHDTEARLGRNLVEIITSPVHHRLIKAADAPHPGIVFSRGIVNSFLLVEATTDPATGRSELTARLRDAAGTFSSCQVAQFRFICFPCSFLMKVENEFR